MTVINPAYALSSESQTPEQFRRLLAGLTNDNVGVFAPGDLLTSEKSGTADMSVDIATGRVMVAGTEATYAGTYFCDNQGVTNVAITTSNGSNPRVDIIVAKVEDAEYSGATSAWSLVAVDGTAAASPVAPALPSNAILIATVAVGTSVSTIVDANITDNRIVLNPGYQSVVITATGAFAKADYPWLKSVRVRVAAGGGGGGGCGSTTASQWSHAGGGGGGGCSEVHILKSALATSETVTVGAGGAAGTGAAGGSQGTASSFGTHAVTAGGGGAGYAVAGTVAQASLCGAGGTVSAGDIQCPGNGGTSGLGLSTHANGAYGGAGGGSAFFGGGTDVRRASEGSLAGGTYGGGGSGVANTVSGSDATGGVGGAGVVIVEIYG